MVEHKQRDSWQEHRQRDAQPTIACSGWDQTCTPEDREPQDGEAREAEGGMEKRRDSGAECHEDEDGDEPVGWESARTLQMQAQEQDRKEKDDCEVCGSQELTHRRMK
jgi:hypothetical protein